MSKQEEGSAVPANSKGSWASFLKSMASFNGDLSSLTAPAFIVSSQSLVEFSAYWTENTSLWIAPTKERDPAQRMLLVTKWLLNTLKQQYCSRAEKLGSEKKPLNPFLGELFIGHWDDEFGRTDLVSEQVSHHPPVTAYCITNRQHGIQLQGYNGQKASFSKTIHIKQIGHALLTLHPPGSSQPETYLITLPPLHIEGLIYGSPYVEIGESSYIASTSGYMAKMSFSGKGWVSGTSNTFTASIWQNGHGSESDAIYSLGGRWSDRFTIKEGSGKKAKELATFTPKDIKLSQLVVAPIEEQDPFESRRAWNKVAQAVVKGDMNAVGHYKSNVENAQRVLRKRETDEKREWQRVFFSHPTPNAPLETQFSNLVKMLGHHWEGVAPEKTGGVWRFDEQKAARASKPFHPEGTAAIGENPDGTSAPVSRTATNTSQMATR